MASNLLQPIVGFRRPFAPGGFGFRSGFTSVHRMSSFSKAAMVVALILRSGNTCNRVGEPPFPPGLLRLRGARRKPTPIQACS